jgi:CRP-like cAMP-binding protein
MMGVVPLKLRQAIHRPGKTIRSVYFPVSVVLSQVSILADGSTTELGVVGHEGMAGLPALLGADSAPFQTMVLVPGLAHRISVDVFCQEAGRPGPLRDELLRYTQAFLSQVAQGMACSQHHSVERRLASALLSISDRAGSSPLPLTQELLAYILGVGRPSVTLNAATLQAAGLIRYHRGHIRITDRRGLETAACECYRVVRAEYERLLA